MAESSSDYARDGDPVFEHVRGTAHGSSDLLVNLHLRGPNGSVVTMQSVGTTKIANESTEDALKRRQDALQRHTKTVNGPVDIGAAAADLWALYAPILWDGLRFEVAKGHMLHGKTLKEWWMAEEGKVLFKLFAVGPRGKFVAAIEQAAAGADNMENFDEGADGARLPSGVLREMQMLVLRNLYSGAWKNAELAYLDIMGVCVRACPGAGKLLALLLVILLPFNYMAAPRDSASPLDRAVAGGKMKSAGSSAAAAAAQGGVRLLADVIKDGARIENEGVGPKHAYLRNGNLVTETCVVTSGSVAGIANIMKNFGPGVGGLTKAQLDRILAAEGVDGDAAYRCGDPKTLAELVKGRWHIAYTRDESDPNVIEHHTVLDKVRALDIALPREVAALVKVFPRLLRTVRFGDGEEMLGLDAFLLRLVKPVKLAEHDPEALGSCVALVGTPHKLRDTGADSVDAEGQTDDDDGEDSDEDVGDDSGDDSCDGDAAGDGDEDTGEADAESANNSAGSRSSSSSAAGGSPEPKTGSPKPKPSRAGLLRKTGFSFIALLADEHVGVSTKQKQTPTRRMLAHTAQFAVPFYFSATMPPLFLANNIFVTADLRKARNFEVHGKGDCTCGGDIELCAWCALRSEPLPLGFTLNEAARHGCGNNFTHVPVRMDGTSADLSSWWDRITMILGDLFAGRGVEHGEDAHTKALYPWVVPRGLVFLKDRGEMEEVMERIVQEAKLRQQPYCIGGEPINFGALFPAITKKKTAEKADKKTACYFWRPKGDAWEYEESTERDMDKVLKLFADKTVHVLFSVRKLDRALNEPGASFVATRALKSTLDQAEQREGRARRAFPSDAALYLRTVDDMRDAIKVARSRGAMSPALEQLAVMSDEALEEQRARVHESAQLSSRKFALVSLQRKLEAQSAYEFEQATVDTRDWTTTSTSVKLFFEPLERRRKNKHGVAKTSATSSQVPLATGHGARANQLHQPDLLCALPRARSTRAMTAMAEAAAAGAPAPAVASPAPEGRGERRCRGDAASGSESSSVQGTPSPTPPPPRSPSPSQSAASPSPPATPPTPAVTARKHGGRQNKRPRAPVCPGHWKSMLGMQPDAPAPTPAKGPAHKTTGEKKHASRSKKPRAAAKDVSGSGVKGSNSTTNGRQRRKRRMDDDSDSSDAGSPQQPAPQPPAPKSPAPKSPRKKKATLTKRVRRPSPAPPAQRGSGRVSQPSPESDEEERGHEQDQQAQQGHDDQGEGNNDDQETQEETQSIADCDAPTPCTPTIRRAGTRPAASSDDSASEEPGPVAPVAGPAGDSSSGPASLGPNASVSASAGSSAGAGPVRASEVLPQVLDVRSRMAELLRRDASGAPRVSASASASSSARTQRDTAAARCKARAAQPRQLARNVNSKFNSAQEEDELRSDEFRYDTFVEKLLGMSDEEAAERAGLMRARRVVTHGEDAKEARCEDCRRVLLAFDGRKDHAFRGADLEKWLFSQEVHDSARAALRGCAILHHSSGRRCVGCNTEKKQREAADFIDAGGEACTDVLKFDSRKTDDGSFVAEISTAPASARVASGASGCWVMRNSAEGTGQCAGPEELRQLFGREEMLCKRHASCAELGCSEELTTQAQSALGMELLCAAHGKCASCGVAEAQLTHAACELCLKDVVRLCASCVATKHEVPAASGEGKLTVCDTCLRCDVCWGADMTSAPLKAPSDLKCWLRVEGSDLMLCAAHAKCQDPACEEVGTMRCRVCLEFEAVQDSQLSQERWFCRAHFMRGARTGDTSPHCSRCSALAALLGDGANAWLLGELLQRLCDAPGVQALRGPELLKHVFCALHTAVHAEDGFNLDEVDGVNKVKKVTFSSLQTAFRRKAANSWWFLLRVLFPGESNPALWTGLASSSDVASSSASSVREASRAGAASSVRRAAAAAADGEHTPLRVDTPRDVTDKLHGAGSRAARAVLEDREVQEQRKLWVKQLLGAAAASRTTLPKIPVRMEVGSSGAAAAHSSSSSNSSTSTSTSTSAGANADAGTRTSKRPRAPPTRDDDDDADEDGNTDVFRRKKNRRDAEAGTRRSSSNSLSSAGADADAGTRTSKRPRAPPTRDDDDDAEEDGNTDVFRRKKNRRAE